MHTQNTYTHTNTPHLVIQGVKLIVTVGARAIRFVIPPLLFFAMLLLGHHFEAVLPALRTLAARLA
jgi:hypothetical protein